MDANLPLKETLPLARCIRDMECSSDLEEGTFARFASWLAPELYIAMGRWCDDSSGVVIETRIPLELHMRDHWEDLEMAVLACHSTKPLTDYLNLLSPPAMRIKERRGVVPLPGIQDRSVCGHQTTAWDRKG